MLESEEIRKEIFLIAFEYILIKFSFSRKLCILNMFNGFGCIIIMYTIVPIVHSKIYYIKSSNGIHCSLIVFPVERMQTNEWMRMEMFFQTKVLRNEKC